LVGAARFLAAGALPGAELRLGLDPDLAPRLAGKLAALAGPDVAVEVAEAWSRDLVEAVRSGERDAAAVLWAPAGAEPGLTSEDLPADDLVLVAAAGMRLALGDEVDAEAVARATLLLPPQGSEVAGRARAERRALGLEPARVATLGSAAAVRAAVSAGAGIGAGLASAFEAEVAAGWLTATRLGPAGALRPRLVVSDRLPPALADEVRAAAGLARRLPVTAMAAGTAPREEAVPGGWKTGSPHRPPTTRGPRRSRGATTRPAHRTAAPPSAAWTPAAPARAGCSWTERASPWRRARSGPSRPSTWTATTARP